MAFFSFGDFLWSSSPIELVRRAMDFTLNTLGNHLASGWNLDQRRKDFKRKLEELNGLKEDTESIMITELQPKKKCKREVQIWLKHVEKINDEDQVLDGRIGGSNFLTRGSLAEDMSRMNREVEELINQRHKFHGGLVVDNPQWIGQVLSTASLSGEAVKTCVKEIWQCLMDDEVGKIGVRGMGCDTPELQGASQEAKLDKTRQEQAKTGIKIFRAGPRKTDLRGPQKLLNSYITNL